MDSIDPIQISIQQAAEVGIKRELSLLGKEDMTRLEARLRAGEDITEAMKAIAGDRIRAQGQGFMDTVKRQQAQDKIREFAAQQAKEFQAFVASVTGQDAAQAVKPDLPTSGGSL